MTLTLLEIYNKVTSQPWSIFETNLTSSDEKEENVVIAIQKALRILWDAHSYSFRLRTQNIMTLPTIEQYKLPAGCIIRDGIRLNENNKILDIVHFKEIKDKTTGIPEFFYVKNDKLCFYPIPDKAYEITINYNTFKLGKNIFNQSIYNLVENTDILDIPEQFEDMFLSALLNKAMIIALTSGNSSIYQPYVAQFIESYKNLIINSKPYDIEKKINW